MYQKKEETLDEFVTRCHIKAANCQFEEAEEQERIIEQILASTPISEFQKFLLDKEKGCSLEDVLNEGRKHEAATNNMKMIRENRCTAGGATVTETGINILKQKIKNYCKCCGKVTQGTKKTVQQKTQNAISVEKLGTGK